MQPFLPDFFFLFVFVLWKFLTKKKIPSRKKEEKLVFDRRSDIDKKEKAEYNKKEKRGKIRRKPLKKPKRNRRLTNFHAQLVAVNGKKVL